MFEARFRSMKSHSGRARPRSRRACSAVLGVFSALLAASVPSAAQESEVTLRMKGGTFQVTGALRAFDGSRYVVETMPHGTMTLDASRFECLGAGCLVRPVTLALPLERLMPGRPDTFAIHAGPGTAARLLPELITGYAESVEAQATLVLPTEPGKVEMRLTDQAEKSLARIDVTAEGSAAAFAALEGGRALLALTDRPLVEGDAAAYPGIVQRLRRPPHQHRLASDALAVVVSPLNPLHSIPLAKLAGILAGTVRDWSEVGLPAGPISLVLGPAEGATASAIARFSAGPRSAGVTAAATRVADDASVARIVTRDPAALGVLGHSAVGNARVLALEDSCGLALRPGAFALKAGEYPFARPLYLYAQPGRANPAAQGLVRFALTPAGQRIVAEQGLADREPSTLAFADHAPRFAHAINAPAAAFDLDLMRQLVSDLEGGERLSLTFRFNDELDAADRLAVTELAAYLAKPENAGKRVLLAGFTDSTGRFAANLTRAQKRASVVRQALLAAAGTHLQGRSITAKGYGPLAPVACDGTQEGQLLNRRVEVWLHGRPS
jgi:phosphate transport system substrate-binding protein